MKLAIFSLVFPLIAATIPRDLVDAVSLSLSTFKSLLPDLPEHPVFDETPLSISELFAPVLEYLTTAESLSAPEDVALLTTPEFFTALRYQLEVTGYGRMNLELGAPSTMLDRIDEITDSLLRRHIADEPRFLELQAIQATANLDGGASEFQRAEFTHLSTQLRSLFAEFHRKYTEIDTALEPLYDQGATENPEHEPEISRHLQAFMGKVATRQLVLDRMNGLLDELNLHFPQL